MTPVQVAIDNVSIEFIAVHKVLMSAILDNINSRKQLTQAILSANGQIKKLKGNT